MSVSAHDSRWYARGRTSDPPPDSNWKLPYEHKLMGTVEMEASRDRVPTPAIRPNQVLWLPLTIAQETLRELVILALAQ